MSIGLPLEKRHQGSWDEQQLKRGTGKKKLTYQTYSKKHFILVLYPVHCNHFYLCAVSLGQLMILFMAVLRADIERTHNALQSTPFFIMHVGERRIGRNRDREWHSERVRASKIINMEVIWLSHNIILISTPQCHSPRVRGMRKGPCCTAHHVCLIYSPSSMYGELEDASNDLPVVDRYRIGRRSISTVFLYEEIDRTLVTCTCSNKKIWCKSCVEVSCGGVCRSKVDFGANVRWRAMGWMVDELMYKCTYRYTGVYTVRWRVLSLSFSLCCCCCEGEWLDESLLPTRNSQVMGILQGRGRVRCNVKRDGSRCRQTGGYMYMYHTVSNVGDTYLRNRI